jgi:hypothetical protein
MQYLIVLEPQGGRLRHTIYPKPRDAGGDGPDHLRVEEGDRIALLTVDTGALVDVDEYSAFTDLGQFRLRPYEETGDVQVLAIDEEPEGGESSTVSFRKFPEEGDPDTPDTPTYVIIDVE